MSVNLKILITTTNNGIKSGEREMLVFVEFELCVRPCAFSVYGDHTPNAPKSIIVTFVLQVGKLRLTQVR